MADSANEINNFLEKCRELEKCKFIMASTKISDLLKAIVSSRQLYDLFMAVMADFDYEAAKASCLNDGRNSYSRRGSFRLPQSEGDKLAFIFCLLADIDGGSINFNAFLQRYFSEDGSFVASYRAFVAAVVMPIKQIVSSVFSEEIKNEEAPSLEDGARLSGELAALSVLITREQQFLLSSALPEEDKETGVKMLGDIFCMLKEGRADIANSLVNGYNYYILYNNTISPDIQTLFEAIDAFGEDR